MILQALNSYYHRLKDDPDTEVPLPGFSMQKISFALVLNRSGELLQVTDLRETVGKKPVARLLNVPEPVKRTAGVSSNFLWDNTGYVLGADGKGKPERTAETFLAFKDLHHEIGDGLDDDGMRAVLCFLDSWDPAGAAQLPHWEEMVGLNLVFMLEDELRFLHERPAIRDGWLAYSQGKSSEVEGYCLVSGERAPIARLHPDIKGVRGAQTKGASIVSFNLDAFASYGKTQNFNAPVGEQAAFAYTTALNRLLASGSRQRVQIGDASTVFWTERPSPAEGFMGYVLNPTDEPGDVQAVRTFLEAARSGHYPPDVDPEIGFFILGLSPNAGRLSVRFWYAGTVGDMADKLRRHFDDLRIVKRFDNDPDYPGLWLLLRETAVQKKSENVPPLLGGAIMRSILTGSPYPASMLAVLLGRIRADQEVNYLRAAMIKACLVRHLRTYNPNAWEVGMALDRESTNTPYRLGRLFAALEKAQRDAVPGANTTIKDRYFGSASATPRAVFPQLIRLAQHHIQKAEYGRSTDKLIEDILQPIENFPAHLKLDEQGMFALGYYHQRQAIYTAKSDGDKEK